MLGLETRLFFSSQRILFLFGIIVINNSSKKSHIHSFQEMLILFHGDLSEHIYSFQATNPWPSPANMIFLLK
jgi:hypothetical protein